MSYSCYIVSKKTGKRLRTREKHALKGGTYCVGGTNELWLNVTYNYSEVYYRMCSGLKEQSLRVLDEMSVEDSIPLLEKSIEEIGDSLDYSRDYWAPTMGNARKALVNLLELANLATKGKGKWVVN